MSKVRTLLAGTALAGALAATMAAAPAAMASTPTAATVATAAAQQAQSSSKHFFGPYYSGFGRGENFGHRSSFKGYYTKDGSGRYWFYGDLVDRDRDRQYSYVWFKWHDRSGFHAKVFKTRGNQHFDKFGGFRKSNGFNDFDIRVCEGTNSSDDCGRWGDAF
ncbi:hypothetical protein SAMN05216276_103116 [Streptosporangium subroseum]|uniref:MORN repeat-containing protein n=1 Tax=Streptosporangium subroseum TaxID=106412 RepID=A0A239L6X9_9ACTN|nr:hypothetical protein [Streptosporangium subroseum]SNT26040.1 hypothetical protein SAMN05216276_103116 [Streptosporangium subroseum]